MKRLLIAILVVLCVALPVMAENVSTNQMLIEKDIDRMLSAMRGKFSLSSHVDHIAEYGGSAVPVLIRKYSEAPEERRWGLVACLCRLPTPESCNFLTTIIQKHTDRKSTSYAIRHYSMQQEADIVDILIEILPVQKCSWDTSERLKDMIFRNPEIAGQLVDELVDSTSSAPKNQQFYDILEHISGNANTWHGRIPAGKITPESQNQFWRDWWKRNQEKEAFDWLIESLYRDEGGRRSHAVQMLGTLKDRRSIPYFVSALDDEEYSVRYWAVVGLKKVDGTYPAGGYLSEKFQADEDKIIAELKAQYADITDNQILDPTWTTPVLKAKSVSQAGQD